jgi:hypothetical protein
MLHGAGNTSLSVTYTFGEIMAFSPGVMQPAEVPRLKELGYDVTYREYEGRHGVTPGIVREAFEWFNR